MDKNQTFLSTGSGARLKTENRFIPILFFTFPSIYLKEFVTQDKK